MSRGGACIISDVFTGHCNFRFHDDDEDIGNNIGNIIGKNKIKHSIIPT